MAKGLEAVPRSLDLILKAGRSQWRLGDELFSWLQRGGLGWEGDPRAEACLNDKAV